MFRKNTFTLLDVYYLTGLTKWSINSLRFYRRFQNVYIGKIYSKFLTVSHICLTGESHGII